MNRIEPTHAYIGVKPCGCVPAICMDEPELADAVAEMVQHGYALERLTVDDARARWPHRCAEHEGKPWDTAEREARQTTLAEAAR